MDWLRRNWPDLLIGVALVAVIAGIIATLISGGTFFPVGGESSAARTAPPTTSAPPTESAPPTQSTLPTQPELPGELPVAPLTPEGEASTGSPSGADESATTQPAEGEAPARDSVTALPLDAQAPPAASGESSGAPTSEGSGDSPSAEAPAASSEAAPTPLEAPAPLEAATSAEAATSSGATAAAEESSYRVSVGAFGNSENAQRAARDFQAAGYPVLLGTQGDLTIVLVGPYASESEARRVADQIKAGNFGVSDPTVYLYEPDGSGAGRRASGEQASSTPAPSASTEAAVSETAASAPTTGGRYLQVGAYATRESSLPQRSHLESLGFTVTEVQEGTLLKLLVGPYQSSALQEAQSRLTAEGIEHFARGL